MTEPASARFGRRSFVRGVALSGLGVAGTSVGADAVFGAESGESPYGPIGDQDGSGVLLPAGFSARIIARSGQVVGGTSFIWRGAPDGGAAFADGAGGCYHAVNHELSSTGGVSVIHHGADGSVLDAYSVLSGTSRNCAGGPTPWGTWLSCEEVGTGRVWECDVTQPGEGVVRPALGRFSHEAVAVDPVRGQLFLTEDRPDGLFYRFRPDAFPSLDAGVLEVAVVGPDGLLGWEQIPDPHGSTTATRYQLAAVSRFNGGEGIWYHDHRVWFTTKGDNGVWEYDISDNRLTRIWNGSSPLSGVDNITVERGSGDIYVAEDGGNMEMVVISVEGTVAPFLRVAGHGGSEITGPCFDPTGRRLFFSSQRGSDGNGVTYEVTGPFRGSGGSPVNTTTTTSTSTTSTSTSSTSSTTSTSSTSTTTTTSTTSTTTTSTPDPGQTLRGASGSVARRAANIAGPVGLGLGAAGIAGLVALRERARR